GLAFKAAGSSSHNLNLLLETAISSFLSGRPGSNRRHSAWKADALPTELLPQFFGTIPKISIFQKNSLTASTGGKNFVGRAGFEPAKVKTNRFTVCPRWPLEYLPALFSVTYEPVEGLEPTTC